MEEALPTLSQGKHAWLSHGAMFGRLLIGLTALYWVGWRLVRADMLPDMFAARGVATGRRRAIYERMTAQFDGSEGTLEANERRLRRLGPTYVVLYALVFTAVAFDGMMALQPHWFSNLFGGWYFMGSFLGGHMLLALMMIYGGQHIGIADLISPKQRHDLGKLCFGFTVFWTYLMWAQFQVIWYGNLPEETGFVFSRLWGEWVPVARLVFLGMFVVPFFGLIGVAPKKTRATLGFFAGVSLAALWLERYILVVPTVTQLRGPRVRASRARPHAAVRRRLPGGLCAVRPDLPHGVPATGGDNAAPRGRSPRHRDLRSRRHRQRLSPRGRSGASPRQAVVRGRMARTESSAPSLTAGRNRRISHNNA